MKMENLSIIGTSHISPESVKQVKETIQKIKPDFVAIELDKGRFLSLTKKQKSSKRIEIRKLGIGGFLFIIIGAWIEKKLGKIVGTEPGVEMKTAINEAAKIKAKVALIDQNINITISRLLKNLTRKEKLTFLYDLTLGWIFQRKLVVKFNLKKVPEDKLIDMMIDLVKDRYPTVYNVLIAERNVYMAKKLMNLMKANPEAKIVAVVGAGHKQGMLEYINQKLY